MNEERTYFSTREAADYLGVSPRTLDRYRVRGGGPVFHRFGGRVRYLRADLDAWALTRRRASTSDDGTGDCPGPGEPPAARRRPGQARPPGAAR